MLLDVKQLSFSYSPEKPLFEGLNLQISEGEITALAGESGCGKSTLLSLIYGLLNWESGEITFNERKLLGPKGNLVPGEADMKFVAQNFDLMPYATVAENIGKFISNINLATKKEKVDELLEVIGMQNFAKTMVKTLSGGQQQRVAIARALSVMPKFLLLDEPFSNLDFPRKIQLREKLLSYAKKENIAVLISTHEIQDVLPWLDKIVILKEGKIIQNGNPNYVFQNHVDEYTARLFGEVNIFNEEEKIKFNLNNFSRFPNEISIAENGYQAQVLESRFAGTYYWNKVSCLGKNLIIYTPNQILGDIFIQFKH